MLQPLPESDWNRSTAAHLLNRAGFGGSPAEINAFAAKSLPDAVQSLLQFQSEDDRFPLPDWAKSVPDRVSEFEAMRDATPEERQKLQRERQRENQQRILELQGLWLRRMTEARFPLREKLALFWHGHFATSIQKVREPYLMARQLELFRQHGAGSWLNLLDLVTRDPAMLLWLDQAQSRREHPNENYARELFELFTLGEGHYTESDVLEAARALTGLTLDRARLEPVYRTRLHDDGEKTILGKTGRWDGYDLLQMIARHPQSARFITAKLWTYFAGSPPSPEWNSVLAETFSALQGEFRPFFAAMFGAREFYAPTVVRRQIKSPVQFLVGAVKHLERDLPPPTRSSNALRLLSQSLFAPPSVKGWDGGPAWINANTLLTRHNLALYLVTGEDSLPQRGPRNNARARRLRRASPPASHPVPLDRILPPSIRNQPEALIATLENRLLQAPFPLRDRSSLEVYLKEQGELSDADLLGLVRLALCTASYQLA